MSTSTLISDMAEKEKIFSLGTIPHKKVDLTVQINEEIYPIIEVTRKPTLMAFVVNYFLE